MFWICWEAQAVPKTRIIPKLPSDPIPRNLADMRGSPLHVSNDIVVHSGKVRRPKLPRGSLPSEETAGVDKKQEIY